MTSELARGDVWKQLSAPLPPAAIRWRQDGRTFTKDAKFFARFIRFTKVAYMRDRLDEVVPGEWSVHLEPLPHVTSIDDDGKESRFFAFRCRLQVLGVEREDVGQGKDWKTASTDAFKRAAFAFGVGRELAETKLNIVQMDGDGKYARPLEDPQTAYERRHGKSCDTQSGASEKNTRESRAEVQVGNEKQDNGRQSTPRDGGSEQSRSTTGADAPPAHPCPQCGTEMRDQTMTKRGKQPDYKCPKCGHAIWLNAKKKSKSAGGEPAELSSHPDMPV